MEPRNRFQGIDSASLCSLADRYYDPIPTRFLAPIDFSKFPAQDVLCYEMSSSDDHYHFPGGGFLDGREAAEDDELAG